LRSRATLIALDQTPVRFERTFKMPEMFWIHSQVVSELLLVAVRRWTLKRFIIVAFDGDVEVM